jgi:hypothetical protein
MHIKLSEAAKERQIAGFARSAFAPMELMIRSTTFLKGAPMLILFGKHQGRPYKFLFWTLRTRERYRTLGRIVLSDGIEIFDHSHLGKARVLAAKIEAATGRAVTITLLDPERDEIRLRESATANPIWI